RAPLARQRGITLIVALVMLVLITLLALTTFNLSKSSIQVISNMQSRTENIAAARQAIDETMSSTRFFSTPDDAIPNPCNGESNTRCVDVNGDGVNDVTVRLTPSPTCVKANGVMNSEVDVTNTENANCLLGTSQSFGVAGSVTGESLCADSTWEINAEATDNVTAAKVNMVQGVTVRVAKDDIETSCPD
ncbi:MAG TPA: PilX N-terminal domain-containing pilus assembly protein, partial [Telluria sp.]|nr:PilX N-terminal domain-containing pilus assembly protein [Telluria sp.]